MKKNFIFTLILMLFATVGFMACSDDDEANLPTPSFEAVSGKYTITTDGSPYQSIELGASGNYIVTLAGAPSYASAVASAHVADARKAFLRNPASTVQTRATTYGYYIYGTYTDLGNGSYQLEDFGTVTLSTDGSGNVTGLTINSGKYGSSTVTVEKEDVVDDSEMTNNLCRTWRIESVRYVYEDKETGEQVDITATPDNYQQFENYMGTMAEEILFSKSGTYFISYRDNTLDAAQWRWNNMGAGILEYAWEGYWDGDYVTISFSGNRMNVSESWEDEYEREEVYYTLVAVDNGNGGTDQPEEPDQPVTEETPVSRVFTGLLPRSVDDEMMIYENGWLVRIVDVDDPTNVDFQFRYNYATGGEGPDVEMLNEAGETILEVTLNEQGWAETVRDVMYDATTIFTYDSEGHIINVNDGREDRYYTLTWTDGDLTRRTYVYKNDDGSWDTSAEPDDAINFEYSAEENSNCFMVYYDFYDIDLDNIEMLYYAGLLGMAPKHQLSKVSHDGGGVSTCTWTEEGIVEQYTSEDGRQNEPELYPLTYYTE